MKHFKKIISSGSRSGFTLIEVLLVVVIIGILVGVAVPKITGRKREAEVAAARAGIDSIGTTLRLYELDHGEYPRSLQDLMTPPANSQHQESYFDKVPKDPWGHEFVYAFPGSHNTHGYDLQSLGPDGAESGDDIANWETTE